MNLFLDSFWRAIAYCFYPRVIVLSLLPLGLVIALSLGLGYFFWDAALDQVRVWIDAFSYINMVWQWLENMGAGQFKAVLAPLLVVIGATPVIVVMSMLAVALLMTPAVVNLVARNRFSALETQRGGGLAASLVWSLFSTLLAGFALLISLPLWLIPPLVLILPPLIWGWLTYRVMAFDALAQHATAEERNVLFKRYGGWLLLMGVVCGYMGASPNLIWAMGAGFAPAFVLLVPLAIWIYMLVFAFASLWFSHFCLAALQALRQEVPVGVVVDAPLAETALNTSVQDATAITWKEGQ
jgi:hypothetical protein